jgi:hypothetical protein
MTRRVDDVESMKIAKLHNGPNGGVLFYGQSEMLAHCAACNGHGVAMAWDMRKLNKAGEEKIVKFFGYYVGARIFSVHLMNVAEGLRHAYEMIVEGTHCCPYLDVEFYADVVDTAFEKFKLICREISKAVLEAYGFAANIRAYDSSRWDTKKGQYKHSYHIYVTNVVVDNNKCRELEQLVSFGVLGDHDLEGRMNSPFYYEEKGVKDKYGNQKYAYAVDMKVYTNNRQMRLPFCSKYGSKVVFRAMLDTAMFGDYINCTPAANDCEEFVWAIIGRARHEVTPRLLPLAAVVTPAAGPRSAAAAKEPFLDCSYPVEARLLLLKLRERGDATSTLGKCSSNGESFKIYCHNGAAERSCLHCCGVTHSSNNFCILLTPSSGGKCFDIGYKCYGCPDIVKKHLGKIKSLIYAAVDSKGVEIVNDFIVRPMMANGFFEIRPDSLFTTYCERLVKSLPEGARLMALCSPCGTGKTKGFLGWIQHESQLCDLQAVIVRHRKALSMKDFETMPPINGVDWVVYNALKGEIDLRKTPFVIIQLESLARINMESLSNPEKKTVFLVDEFNSIVVQLKSTCGNVVQSAAVFSHLFQHANNVIVMDGFLVQETLDIAEKYAGEPAHLILNTFKSRADHKFEFTSKRKKTISWMLDCIARGERHICPCFAKCTAKQIYKMAKRRFGDTKKVILYTNEHQWDGTDVNKAWKDADLVIFTSTIDCGVSFELSNHFDCCTAFLNNAGAPTFEAALQMISRARDVKAFRICIVTYKQGEEQKPPDVDSVLSEHGPEVRKRDVILFGTRVGIVEALKNKKPTWANCTATTSSYIWDIVMRRRTQQCIVKELYTSLRRDGAQIASKWIDYLDVVDTGDVAMEEKEGTVQVTARGLAEIADHYGSAFARQFQLSDDAAKLKPYQNKRRKNAFKNINVLAANGVDFDDAMRRITADSAQYLDLLDTLDQKTGDSMRAATDVARKVGGGMGNNNYVRDANTAARALLVTIVGHGDPFSTKDHRDIDIQQSLGCTVETLADTTTESCVSSEMHKTILDQYQQWIDIDPERNATSSFPSREQPLIFKKALQVLRHVLETMYDISFQRHGNRKQFRGVPYYVLKLVKSKFFANTPSERIQRKPMVAPWLVAPRDEISDDQMMDIDRTHHIVKPGDAYLKSRGESAPAPRAAMQPLRPEDVLSIDEAPSPPPTRSAEALMTHAEAFMKQTAAEALMTHAAAVTRAASAHVVTQAYEKATRKRKARDNLAEAKRQKKRDAAACDHYATAACRGS